MNDHRENQGRVQLSSISIRPIKEVRAIVVDTKTTEGTEEATNVVRVGEVTKDIRTTINMRKTVNHNLTTVRCIRVTTTSLFSNQS